MSEVQDFYGRFSNSYDRERSNPYFQLIEELEYSLLRQVISKFPGDPAIIEIGCGTGIFLDRLRPNHKCISGLDYTSEMLEVAMNKQTLHSVPLVQGDAQQLPYADDSFDIVFSFKALSHIPDLQSALVEIRRVLRPNGIAVLEFYNRQSIRYLLHRSDYFHHWHSPKDIFRLLESHGYRVNVTSGARIVTPMASVLSIPVLGAFFRAVERRLSRTGLKRFAGYFIVVCQATSTIGSHES